MARQDRSKRTTVLIWILWIVLVVGALALLL